MFGIRKPLLVVLMLLLLATAVACQSQEVEVTRVVTETITEAGEEVEVTRIVTETVTESGEEVEVTRIVTETITEEVVVVATPDPVAQVLKGAFTTGPGGGEVEVARPWSGGAGHTLHIKSYVSPVVFDENLVAMVPYAAESWTANDDFTVWTFNLREDIKWSDGEPLSAADWKFTADFISDSEWTSDRTAHRDLAFQQVAGYAERVAGETDELTGVQIVDDYTVEYTLSDPNPRFFTTQFRTYILPEHAVDFSPAEHLTTDWYRDPDRMVGAGPFVMAEFEQDAYMILEKNPFYFEGEPKLDQIVVRMFHGDITAAVLALAAGEIDFTYINPTDIPTLDNLAQDFDYYFNNSTVVVYADIHYPNVPEFWQDIRVRQAVLYAIDREAITSQILQETHYPIPCPVPFPEFWPDDVDWYEYDPAKASDLLAEAGVDPADIQMEWVGHAGYDNIMNNSALQAVQAYLSEVGITEFTYRFVDVPSFRERYTADGEWTIHYRGWGSPIYGQDYGTKWNNSGSQGGDFKGYDMAAVGLEDAIAAINVAPDDDGYFDAIRDFCGLHNELLPDLQLWVGNRYGAAVTGIDNFWWQPAGGGGPYKDNAHLWEMTGN